jgi:hypothetical protein
MKGTIWGNWMCFKCCHHHNTIKKSIIIEQEERMEESQKIKRAQDKQPLLYVE